MQQGWELLLGRGGVKTTRGCAGSRATSFTRHPAVGPCIRPRCVWLQAWAPSPVILAADPGGVPCHLLSPGPCPRHKQGQHRNHPPGFRGAALPLGLVQLGGAPASCQWESLYPLAPQPYWEFDFAAYKGRMGIGTHSPGLIFPLLTL